VHCMSVNSSISSNVKTSVSASLSFKPYVISRKAALNFTDLEKLSVRESLQLFERSKLISDERQLLGSLLVDELSKEVPGKEKSVSHLLVNLKRDIHNDRIVKDSTLVIVRNILPKRLNEQLTEWLSLKRQEQDNTSESEQHYAAALETIEQYQARLAASPDFLKGVQLSGHRIFKEVERYLIHREANCSDNKKIRKTENTVLRFLYRMAHRTTPYASFTHLSECQWDTTLLTPKQIKEPGLVHSAKVSRGLISWMLYQLSFQQGISDSMLISMNSTAVVSKDEVSAYVRGRDGSPTGYWGEKFLTLKLNDTTNFILKGLADQSLTKRALVTKLQTMKVPEASAVKFINNLLETGLFEIGFEIPEQIPDLTRVLADKLRLIETKQAREVAEIFDQLYMIEQTFSNSDIETRKSLIQLLDELITQFSLLCKIEKPPQVGRSNIYEDVSTTAPDPNWDPELVKESRCSFERLQRSLPIFDISVIERMGVYRWYQSRERITKEESLLDIYRDFSALAQEQVTDIMSGVNNELIQPLYTLREKFHRHLESAIDNRDYCAQNNTLQLDSSFLESLADQIPSYVPAYEEMSCKVQLDSQQKLVVLKDISAGYGIFFSRFCELLDQHSSNSPLSKRIREANRSMIQSADIVGTFGLNVNLHPKLTDLEVVYPGSMGSKSHRLCITEIGVKADPIKHQLRLFDKRTGRSIELVPMNFIFPGAAPNLYRFLCTFSPLINVGPVLFNHNTSTMNGESYCRPRINFDSLTIYPKQWVVDLVQTKEFLSQLELCRVESFSQLRRWYVSKGMPSRVNFFIQENRSTQGTWVNEAQLWALEARTARSKPQFIELDNPIGIRLLIAQLRETQEGNIIFTEILPSLDSYHGKDRAVSEFVIETSVTDPATQKEEINL
jgi:hypothetical protein